MYLFTRTMVENFGIGLSSLENHVGSSQDVGSTTIVGAKLVTTSRCNLVSLFSTQGCILVHWSASCFALERSEDMAAGHHPKIVHEKRKFIPLFLLEQIQCCELAGGDFGLWLCARRFGVSKQTARCSMSALTYVG